MAIALGVSDVAGRLRKELTMDHVQYEVEWRG